MVRIISDTSTLYSTQEAQDAGFDVAPLSVTIGTKSYKEFDEISSQEFIRFIEQGHIPLSSQPSVGDVEALFAKYPDDEILNISIADGLSGAWQSAVAAASLNESPQRISVINSRTLCGPHRHMVEIAVKLANEGFSRAEIINRITPMINSAASFLLPSDFDYLRRGGRLSPLVSYVGQVAQLSPILTQSEDGKQLLACGVKRNYTHAVEAVAKKLMAYQVDESFYIYISHAERLDLATRAEEILSNIFPTTKIVIYPLSPAFITQGGPNCVAIQIMRVKN